MIADINWEALLTGKTVEQQYQCIYVTIEKASEKCIRVSNKSNSGRKKKQLWMNREAMKKLKWKYSAWKHYCDTEEYIDYVCSQSEKKELAKLTKKLCKDFEHEITKNIKYILGKCFQIPEIFNYQCQWFNYYPFITSFKTGEKEFI
jgi:hypothetical protein